MKLAELNDATLEAYLQSSRLPTLIVFHAQWSQPARTMLPVVREVAAGYEHAIRFALIDGDLGGQTIARYGVLTLPAYLLFKQQQLSDRFTGLMSKETLTERIEAGLENIA